MASELHPSSLFPALTAGFVGGILAISASISYAALVFSADLTPYLSAGVGLALFAALILGVFAALGSSLPPVIAKPQDTGAAIQALIAGTIAAVLIQRGATEQVLPTVIVSIVLAALLVGVSFLLLGVFRLGSLIRFLPYPVVGGFLAGTGWLLCVGALRVMLDQSITLATLPSLLQPYELVHWLPGVLFGLTLFLLRRRIGHFLVTPAMLILGIAVFYVVLWITGISVTTAGQDGWLLGPFPAGSLWRPPSVDDFVQANWAVLASQSLNLVALVLISAITLLLNATGLELATRRDMDLDRELRVAGLGNLVTGVGGGLAGYQSLSISLIGPQLGSNSRLVGLIAGGLAGLTLWQGGGILTLVPRVVLGGLIISVGLDFLVAWAFDSRRSLPRLDYALVLLILLVIGALGFLPGVGLGVSVAVVLFVVNYSRINVVKNQLTGKNYASNVDRAPDHRHLLQAQGEQVFILKLQGFLFFGTANSLLERIRARLHDPSQALPRFVVLDFHLATGLDSSAALSFTKLSQVTQSRHITLVLTSLSAEVRRQLFLAGYRVEHDSTFRIFPDLDRGVEWCEDRLLEATRSDAKSAAPLVEQLAQQLPDERAGARLVTYLERQEAPVGTYLIHQGAPPDDMFLLETGRVTVLLELPNGRQVRLRAIGAGSLVGEIGFYLNAPRTASVVVEEPAVVYRLTKAALHDMLSRDPALAAAVHDLVARALAERVMYNNATIAALMN